LHTFLLPIFPFFWLNLWVIFQVHKGFQLWQPFKAKSLDWQRKHWNNYERCTLWGILAKVLLRIASQHIYTYLTSENNLEIISCTVWKSCQSWQPFAQTRSKLISRKFFPRSWVKLSLFYLPEMEAMRLLETPLPQANGKR